ncbi:hypothetical protein DB345_09630 [Spartobacteria bacterium LR76]|nr:hypothetical protein DB345_09630 [Spartobacteria bacterium LR76]
MKVRYYIPVFALALLHPMAVLLAQQSPVEPQTIFTVLLIDRPTTEAESAGAEGTVKSLDPTVYYRAPTVRGGGDVSFLPLVLPVNRPANPVALPKGQPLELFSKPSADARITSISPSAGSAVTILLRASRDKGFVNAKTTVLNTEETAFPFGTMRVINASDRPVSLKNIDSSVVIEPGETRNISPARARRDNVPFSVAVQDGIWKEIDSSSIKLPADQRATLLITSAADARQRTHYDVVALIDVRRDPVP